MTRSQKLGQLRAILTALGSALAVWGFSDPSGTQWLPIIGVILALVSLTWGILHHRDPKSPGRLSWSLLRKAVNATGSAAITYGLIHPEKVQGIEMLVAAIGPLIAASFSWVDNENAIPDDDIDRRFPQ